MKTTNPTAAHTPDVRKACPYVGQPITVRNVPCQIVKVRPFGTLDVVSLDGKNAFRVSGLSVR